jgi:hypothetical protein
VKPVKPVDKTQARQRPTNAPLNYRPWSATNTPKGVPYNRNRPVRPQGNNNNAPNGTSHRYPATRPGINVPRAAPGKTTSDTRKAVDKQSLQCFRCHGFGHIAPNCPYGAKDTPRKAAAAQLMNDHEIQMGDSPLEGDQYDPEMNNDLLAYEQDQVQEFIPDEDDPQYDMPAFENAADDAPDDAVNDDEVIEDPALYWEEEEQHASAAGILIPIGPELQAKVAVTQPEPTPTVYRHRASRKALPGEQPVREFRKQLALCGYIKVAGHRAHVMLDTGCTTDMVSPDFLAVIGQVPFELDHPVGLQMATRGSRTRINYGYRANIQIGQITAQHYVDVANIDQYDIILGAGFLRKHHAVLDFSVEDKAALIIQGHKFIENLGDFGSPMNGRATPSKIPIRRVPNGPSAKPAEVQPKVE